MGCSFFFFGFDDFPIFLVFCILRSDIALMYRAEKRREKVSSMRIERMYAEC